MSTVSKRKRGEDSKETSMNHPNHVNLKVKGLDGTEVCYRVKRNLPLGQLLNTYCERQSLEFKTVAFLLNGKRIKERHTPAQLHMEDGDEIDAMLHQGGGGPEV
ncbi:hypothetical protein AQUCO_07200098v1 [Aquilegia coerulea]|uniref:Small ubiquitin-related modifier n=1 Tax=Aquilegia coerulea TaxID=218851 RepID=A0A2G5CAB4_AQUCA|nr:hypothetical protein AQUCO_07200098v1 [Aquilegia coerulea]